MASPPRAATQEFTVGGGLGQGFPTGALAASRSSRSATDSYRTTMVEMGAGCETCHGPMKAHVQWRRSFPNVKPPDPTVRKISREEYFDACAACHARRIEGTGALITAAGLVLFGLALQAFGESWRMGLDRDEPGPLATGGVFGWSRNPTYLSFDLLTVGALLIQGRLIFLGLALSVVRTLHRQILRGERFPTQTYGGASLAYCAQVARYVTWPDMGKPRRRGTANSHDTVHAPSR